MKLRKGDAVRITAGLHAGLFGIVLAVFETEQGGGAGYARGGFQAVNIRTLGGNAVTNVPVEKVEVV